MNLAGNQLFSKEALDKLRSPERLDTLLSVTNSISWMLLTAILIFIGSIVLWSIFGAFTVKADGMGLIMDSAGVVDIYHFAGGKVTDIYVSKGDVVKTNDIIARVVQVERYADTAIAQHGIGLVGNDREAASKAYEYDAKRAQQILMEEVYSDYDGIVDDIMISKGAMISGNTPICSIRLTQNNSELSGIFYIPLEKGKRVEAGMTIQLMPNGVDVSESGSLLGVVRSVSQYPVSVQSVQKNVGNSQVAQWFFEQQKSSLMEVRFDLVKNSEDTSGFLWTSKVGDHKPITPGSFCKGSIVIERKPPIEKVFYKVSQWLRSR